MRGWLARRSFAVRPSFGSTALVRSGTRRARCRAMSRCDISQWRGFRYIAHKSGCLALVSLLCTALRWF